MTNLRKFFWVAVAFLLPVVTRADITVGNPSSPSNPKQLTNPLKGFNSLKEFVEAVLNNIVLPIGSIVVVMYIIYTGYLFVTARGSEDKLEKAKHSLVNVLIGTAILLGAVAISAAVSGTLHQIVPTLPR